MIDSLAFLASIDRIAIAKTRYRLVDMTFELEVTFAEDDEPASSRDSVLSDASPSSYQVERSYSDLLELHQAILNTARHSHTHDAEECTYCSAFVNHCVMLEENLPTRIGRLFVPTEMMHMMVEGMLAQILSLIRSKLKWESNTELCYGQRLLPVIFGRFLDQELFIED
ncbi:hypothetical protein Poli38472_002606 [Pythium oligandrum]|uniref:Uncharacterized protein n=1 Tax=Pythium oligandrum TaxID=41045 RepID=A0A8K1CJ55_PYTOL|nr:hypothetical protein Poli38472_002606 [Pythium oligandrum]|eukprot:TMW63665.1 hypothetical protein Poli38472_002606 [Pythium oligandrum]